MSNTLEIGTHSDDDDDDDDDDGEELRGAIIPGLTLVAPLCMTKPSPSKIPLPVLIQDTSLQ